QGKRDQDQYFCSGAHVLCLINKIKKITPPISPTVIPIGISKGKMINLPSISHIKRKIAPKIAVIGKVFFKLSPKSTLTIFGTTSPKNGIVPMVSTTTLTVMDTQNNPIFITAL